ncbi:SRPBCC domain-containing protein [Roseibacillus persicicus]|uniref:SRPBCC domain-containing protein n=1 Tax=Roseibacillus persicicus TaxID=454148 RepID=UPI00398A8D1E
MLAPNPNPLREIVSSRRLPAHPERVFKALTEAEYLKEWWGPKGFTNTFHQFDSSPGGAWDFDMRSPEGEVFANRNVFETVEPNRIVIQHLETVHHFWLIVTMEPEGTGTLLDWRMQFDDETECERAKSYVPRCNEECFDRLESVLARIPGPDTDERELRLTRIFNCSPEKVFQAWTRAEILKQWFAPLPYTTPVAELDCRTGGSSYIVMSDPEGNEMPLRGVYLEVVENERIVSTDAYTAPWEPSEKPFLTLELTFEEIAPGRTRYTARARHWSVEERRQHEEMGFYEGWAKCADQLANLVEKS